MSVWGSSFVGCHPARLRPSVLPSVLPSFRPSLTHTIILSSDLFPSFVCCRHLLALLVISHLTHTIISSSRTHTHTLILSSHISHSYTQSSHHLTHTLILSSHLFLSFLSVSLILFHSLSSPLDLLALLFISHTHTLILSSHLFLSFLSVSFILFFPTSLCGVLILLAAIPPDSVLPSFPPSFPPSFRPSVLPFRPSLTHTIILSSDLFPSFVCCRHLLALLVISHLTHTIISSSHAHTHTHSSCQLTSHIHTHNHLIISHTHTHLVISPLSLISLSVFHSLISSPLDLLALLVISQSHTQSSSRPHPLTTSSIRPSGHISHPQWPA